MFWIEWVWVYVNIKGERKRKSRCCGLSHTLHGLVLVLLYQFLYKWTRALYICYLFSIHRIFFRYIYYIHIHSYIYICIMMKREVHNAWEKLNNNSHIVIMNIYVYNLVWIECSRPNRCLDSVKHVSFSSLLLIYIVTILCHGSSYWRHSSYHSAFREWV